MKLFWLKNVRNNFCLVLSIDVVFLTVFIYGFELDDFKCVLMHMERSLFEAYLKETGLSTLSNSKLVNLFGLRKV